jgi:hypothetical protein
MSDGMAFLTGAAFAGVAVLFMLKGGNNLGATNLPLPSPQPLQVSPTNPYDPYARTPQGLTPSPNPTAYPYDLQRQDGDRLRAMLEQQRVETEQLKTQLQNQQLLIEKLTAQTVPSPSPSPTWSKPATPASNQQQENSILSGLVWGLGGMAVTISGGVVVIGVLAVLSRQQRPPRTTYVVQQPTYSALPPSRQPRRRDVMPPALEERRIDYVDYDG